MPSIAAAKLLATFTASGCCFDVGLWWSGCTAADTFEKRTRASILNNREPKGLWHRFSSISTMLYTPCCKVLHLEWILGRIWLAKIMLIFVLMLSHIQLFSLSLLWQAPLPRHTILVVHWSPCNDSHSVWYNAYEHSLTHFFATIFAMDKSNNRPINARSRAEFVHLK